MIKKKTQNGRALLRQSFIYLFISSLLHLQDRQTILQEIVDSLCIKCRCDENIIRINGIEKIELHALGRKEIVPSPPSLSSPAMSHILFYILFTISCKRNAKIKNKVNYMEYIRNEWMCWVHSRWVSEKIWRGKKRKRKRLRMRTVLVWAEMWGMVEQFSQCTIDCMHVVCK